MTCVFVKAVDSEMYWNDVWACEAIYYRHVLA